MSWENALAYCEGLNLAGQTDWRIPHIDELKSLVNPPKSTPPNIDTTAFGSAVSTYYWASYSRDKPLAWRVYFGRGFGPQDLTSRFQVRCVL